MGERKAIHCADPANQSVQLTIWRPKGRKDTPLTINTISHTLWGVLKGNFWADTGLSLGSLNVGANCICVGRSRLSPYPNVARGVRYLQEMPQDLSSLCLDLGIYRIIPLFHEPVCAPQFRPREASAGIAAGYSGER